MKLENIIFRLLISDKKGISYLEYGINSGQPPQVVIENWLIFFLNKKLGFPRKATSFKIIDFLVGKLAIEYDYLWENLKPLIKGD